MSRYSHGIDPSKVAKTGDILTGDLSFLSSFPQLFLRSSTPVAPHDVRTAIICDKDAWIGFSRNAYLGPLYTWLIDSAIEPSGFLGIDSDAALNFYTMAAGVDPNGVSGVFKIDVDGTLFLSPAATTTNPVATFHTIQRSGSTNTILALSQTGTGNSALLLDASNGDFAGGDYAQIRHNNDLSLDIFNGDSALTNIKMNQAGLITITGALKFDITSIPVATNNAAAATANVVVGGLYRTNADPSVVMIRTA